MMFELIINTIYAVFQVCCILYTIYSFFLFIGGIVKNIHEQKVIDEALRDAAIAEFKKGIDNKKIN